MADDSPMENTSLDGLDISVQAQPWRLTRTQRRLLRHDEDAQVDLISAIASSDLDNAEKRATRVNCCSQTVQVGVSAGGQPAIQFFRCRDRLCYICARYRMLAATERIEGMLQRMLSPKLLTLTLADDGGSLESRLDRIVKSYRDLRRRQVWKRNVEGAAAVIEVTRGAQGDRWHVHLHCIIDAEYIPQATLSDEWFDCTGDSRVVDIRAIPSGKKAARYLAKYAAKGCNTKLLDHSQLIEFLEAMHRRRTLITSGSMHGLKIDHDDWEPRNEPEGQTISVAKVRRASIKGCHAANEVLNLMEKSGGLPALFASEVTNQMGFSGEGVWTHKDSAEFRIAFRRTVVWIEDHQQYMLPKARPFTGKQRELRE